MRASASIRWITMNTKRSPKRLLAHIALFIGLIALTFFILLRGQDRKSAV